MYKYLFSQACLSLTVGTWIPHRLVKNLFIKHNCPNCHKQTISNLCGDNISFLRNHLGIHKRKRALPKDCRMLRHACHRRKLFEIDYNTLLCYWYSPSRSCFAHWTLTKWTWAAYSAVKLALMTSSLLIKRWTILSTVLWFVVCSLLARRIALQGAVNISHT